MLAVVAAELVGQPIAIFPWNEMGTKKETVVKVAAYLDLPDVLYISLKRMSPLDTHLTLSNCRHFWDDLFIEPGDMT